MGAVWGTAAPLLSPLVQININRVEFWLWFLQKINESPPARNVFLHDYSQEQLAVDIECLTMKDKIARFQRFMVHLYYNSFFYRYTPFPIMLHTCSPSIPTPISTIRREETRGLNHLKITANSEKNLVKLLFSWTRITTFSKCMLMQITLWLLRELISNVSFKVGSMLWTIGRIYALLERWPVDIPQLRNNISAFQANKLQVSNIAYNLPAWRGFVRR